MICAGRGASRMPPSQHGQAYLTRSCRMTRTCCGMMSSCSLDSTPISRSAAPSCGHTRSPSGSSWRITSRGSAGSSGLRPRLVRLWPGTSTLSLSSLLQPSSIAGSACAPRSSASLKNMSFCRTAASLLAAKSCRVNLLSFSLRRSRSARVTRSSPASDSLRLSASASACCNAVTSSGVGMWTICGQCPRHSPGTPCGSAAMAHAGASVLSRRAGTCAGDGAARRRCRCPPAASAAAPPSASAPPSRRAR